MNSQDMPSLPALQKILFHESEHFHCKYIFTETISNLEAQAHKEADTLLNQHSKTLEYLPSSIQFPVPSSETGNYLLANKNRTLNTHASVEIYQSRESTSFASVHFTNFLIYFIVTLPNAALNSSLEDLSSSLSFNPDQGFIENFLVPQKDEDPSLVIFLAFNFRTFKKCLEFLEAHLKALPYTCHAIILFENQITTTYLYNNIGHFKEVESFSRDLSSRSKNLAQTTFYTFAAPKIHNCSEIGRVPSYYFNSCVIKIIKEQLNISFSFTTFEVLYEKPTQPGELPPPLDFGLNIIFNGELNDAFNFHQTNQVQTLDRWVISNPSFQSFPYAYITVGPRLPNGMTAITKPYQYKVWICIFTTGIVFPIFITLILVYHRKFKYPHQTHKPVNLTDLAFISFAGALSQCDDHSTRAITNSKLVGCLWMLWNFGSVVILNAYDGQFFSFLTSETEFFVPSSLEDLVGSKISTFVTFSSIWTSPTNKSENKGQLIRASALKDVLLKDMIQSKDEYPEYYKQFNEVLQRFFLVKPAESTAEAMANIINKKYPFSEETFALIDYEDTITMFRNLISRMNGRRVSRIVGADNFVMRYASLTRRSYIAPLVNRIFSDLFESGHLGMWNENHQKRLGKQTLKLLNGWWMKGLHGLGKGTLLSYQYGSVERDDIRDCTANPTPIPWSLIRNCVDFALILVAVGLLVFIFEVAQFCFGKVSTRKEQSCENKN